MVKKSAWDRFDIDLVRRLGGTTELIRIVNARPEGLIENSIDALAHIKDGSTVPILLSLLDDKDPKVRGASIRALGKLHALDRVPDLLGGLKGTPKSIRTAWASALCWTGRRKGVEGVLELNPDIFLKIRYPLPTAVHGLLSLNAVRSPMLWKTLRDTRLRGDLRGTPVELIEMIGKQAGLKMKILPDVPHHLAWTGHYHRRRIANPLKNLTLLDALEEVVGMTRQLIVLDVEHIRLPDQGDALRYWRSWWAEEQKKQPKK